MSRALVTAAALAGLLSALAPGGGAEDAGGRSTARPTLVPRTLTPLSVKGAGFQRRERVRVTVTPTGGAGVTRHVRARRTGAFTVTFRGVDACNGVAGVAVGRRGSRASFNFATAACPGA